MRTISKYDCGLNKTPSNAIKRQCRVDACSRIARLIVCAPLVRAVQCVLPINYLHASKHIYSTSALLDYNGGGWGARLYFHLTFSKFVDWIEKSLEWGICFIGFLNKSKLYASNTLCTHISILRSIDPHSRWDNQKMLSSLSATLPAAKKIANIFRIDSNGKEEGKTVEHWNIFAAKKKKFIIVWRILLLNIL